MAIMMLSPHPYTLRQLQYAVAVADALSFRKAAERCHVSQPSLSAQLAQLEDALGVRLFDRGRHGVLVTTAGKALVDRARRLLVDADDLLQAAGQLGDPLSGPLRLGVIPTVSPYLLPLIAPALRRKHPALRPAWIEEKTDTLLHLLETGALDAAVLALDAEVPGLERDVIAQDPFLLATPVGHPLGKSSAPASPKELREANVLLLDEGHCLREQVLAICSRAKANELEYRATSLSTLTQMVAGGAGVTLLPKLAVPTESRRANLELRTFTAPQPHRTLALVWRRGASLTEALKEIAATMRSAYPR
jgi:LysR family transcriptional regulator, hydrogen peroxide-inducible genes activator